MRPLSLFISLALPLLTLACSSAPQRAGGGGGGGYYKDDGPGSIPLEQLGHVADAVPRIEPLSEAAKRPYRVMGQSFTPMTGFAPYRERGIGSWYGKKFHGRRTAIGEEYNMYTMTAAHPTLPLPSYARVTNLGNGRSVVVRVNDRGPFLNNRIIDLSYVAAYRLGYVNAGSARVEVEAILPDEIRLAQAGREQVQPLPVAEPEPPRQTRLPPSTPIHTVGSIALAPLAPAAAPTPPAAMPPAAMPPAGMPPAGMPPAAMPPAGMPPVAMPPAGMPPAGMPPVAMPPAAMPPTAMPPAGMPPAGMPPAGMPPAGMPPAGMPPAGMPPAGMPPAGMPPAGMPPAAMPPAGMPPAGMPPAGMPPAAMPPAGMPPAAATSGHMPPPPVLTSAQDPYGRQPGAFPRIPASAIPPQAPAPAMQYAASQAAIGESAFIQLGAFSNADSAHRLLAKARSALSHWAEKIQLLPQQEHYRVQIGPFGSRSEAQAALPEIGAALGLKPFVVMR